MLTILGANGESEAHALALQADGKIVIAGSAHDDRSETSQDGPALARYLPDGTLDPSFGDGGVVVTLPLNMPPDQLDGTYQDLAIQSGGTIITVGTFSTPFASLTSPIAVARYRSDGVLDRTFGTDGFATVELDGITFESAIVLQPSGRIVVAGGNADDNGNDSLFLVRFDHEGRRDPSFGDAGLVTADPGRQTFGHVLATAPGGTCSLARRAICCALRR